MHVKQELVRNESTQIILYLCMKGFPRGSLMSVVNTICSPELSNNLINIDKVGKPCKTLHFCGKIFHSVSANFNQL